MSVTTHLKLLTICESWGQGQEPAQTLLQELLPLLQDVMQTSRQMHLYLLDGHTLKAEATTNEQRNEALKVNPLHSQALTLRKPFYDQARAVYVVPLLFGVTPYGILEVEAEESGSEALDWLMLFGASAAQAIELRSLRERPPQAAPKTASGHTLLNRQKLAMGEILAAPALPLMAQGVARHLLTGQALTLFEVAHDDSGAITSWKPTYTNHNYPAQELAWEALEDSVRGVLIEGDVESFDTPDEAQHIGEAVAQWVDKHGLKSGVFYPLLSSGRVSGVLMITSKESPVLTDDEMTALDALIGQISAQTQMRALFEQTKSMRSIVDNLALANRLIAVAQSHANMAQSVAYTVARDRLAVGLTLFTKPITEKETTRHRMLVGLATADEIKPVNSDLIRQFAPTPEHLEKLRTGVPVVLNNLRSSDSFLSEQTQIDYAQLGARWVASFGLRAGGELIGTLDILHDQQVFMSRDEIDTYSTLADQIGLLITSKRLYEEAKISQQMAAQLVQTNSRIATAEDYTEMADVIIEALPEAIELVAILLFDEPISNREMPRYMRAEAIATRSEVYQPDPEILDETPEGSVAAVRAVKQLLDGELIIVEDTREVIDNPVPNIMNAFAKHGLYSYASLALRTGSRLLGSISFAARDRAALRSIHPDTLKAISGQLAIAIENRNLLNQTADALSFVAAQYEMSTALFRAQTTKEMLSVLYRFASEIYDRAQLGLVDEQGKYVRVVASIDPNSQSEPEAETQTLYTMPVPDNLNDKDTIISANDGKLLTMPLYRRDGNLIGLVQMISTHLTYVPFNQVRALRTLADQLAIILENRFLLQETDKALAETRILYELNQSLMGAQDSLDILNVIKRTIAQRARAIALVDINYDPLTEQVNDFRVYALLGPDFAERPKVALYTPEKAEDFEMVQAHWDINGNQVEFLTNVDDVPGVNPTFAYLVSRELTAYSAVIIPIYDENLLRHQVVVGFDGPQRFTERDHRVYNSLKDQVRLVIENQRLLRDISASAGQLGSQVRVLQALNEFVSQISVAQDETSMLNNACEALVNALRVDHAGIAMLNPDGKSARVMGEYPSTRSVGIEIPSDNSLQARIIATRQPVIIPNIEKDTLMAEGPRRSMMNTGVKSVMILPLINTQGQLLGTVGLDSFRENLEFTQQMNDIARTIMSQVMISLQNVRQFQSTQRQAAQLQKLAELSQSVQTQLDTPSILETALGKIPEIFEVDHINIYLASFEKMRPYLFLQYENGERHELPPLILPEGLQTAANESWKQRDLVFSPDTRIGSFVHTSRPELLSVIIAPMFSRGVPIGMIEIGHSTPFKYSNADALIYRQMVNQISIAVENAEAYTATQRIARSKALVNEISSQLQQQIDIEDVLNVTVTELGRALGARKARIRLGKVQDEK